MDELVIAIFLATANKALVDWITGPLKARYPNIDWWWLVYVTAATGIVLGWLSEVNLFAEFMPDVLIGRILTALVVGAGASFIQELFGSSGGLVAMRDGRSRRRVHF